MLSNKTLVAEMVQSEQVLKLSSKDVQVSIPSAVKNKAIRDAKSVYRRSKQLKRVSILKNLFAYGIIKTYFWKKSCIYLSITISIFLVHP